VRLNLEIILMKIRPLVSKDRDILRYILIASRVFTEEEIYVAMELIDIVLKDPNQKDYKVKCVVDENDYPVGYICYGPVPMTKGTFDIYWIVVNPDFQHKGIGSSLLDSLEKEVKEMKGRMILADTSSIQEYEKAKGFYLTKGFQEVARVSDYYWPGNDRITFCKRLSE